MALRATKGDENRHEFDSIFVRGRGEAVTALEQLSPSRSLGPERAF